ncbi:MAG: membrane protein insertion efficiency factor YidD [Candidatus Methylomirabilales bacterium]
MVKPSLAVRATFLLLDGYRWLVSPFLSPACRFIPSCSTYARQAFERHGFLRGLSLTAWRLLRCHPYCAGGEDSVP